jgi:hypothetical protein
MTKLGNFDFTQLQRRTRISLGRRHPLVQTTNINGANND